MSHPRAEDGVVIEGRTGGTVKNCVFEGFGVAVLLWESHGNTIKSNVAGQPAEGGHGISLFYSDNNTVKGNTLFHRAQTRIIPFCRTLGPARRAGQVDSHNG